MVVYFYGSWYLTASFLLSVLPEVFWNIGLFGETTLVSSSTGELSSARAVYSKILAILSLAPF